ncbi:MAG: twitch domain-containing radical SAM protein [Pseudobdellovibrio sp.]
MNRKHGESFLDYKKRIIDSKSASFCGAKWYNATIWLGSGMTTSCHHPPAHPIGLEEVKNNYKAIHNTPHKKEMRRLMQVGEKPTECEYCWKIEGINPNNISDRVFKTEIYKDEDLAKAFLADYREDTNLKTLEIAFDRNCNFACSYCNAAFSTKWAADIVKNGAYVNLKSDGAGHFTTAKNEAEPFKLTEANPYIEAFWDWWPELSNTLQEIRITGGEPLLNKNTWKFFEYFEQHQDTGNMIFAINSNLGADDSLINKLVEKSKYVKRLKLFTSCEATGTHAEYIRDGLNYEKWRNNLNKVLSEAKLEACNIMMTINALCLFSIVDFLNQILEIKSKYPTGYLNISVNILRFPSFQSVLTLPLEIRTQKSIEIKKWIEANKTSKFFYDFEIESLSRLAEYLLTPDNSPHHKTSPLSLRMNDFKLFYEQYDVRRSKSFEKTFPADIVAWYKSL